MSNYKTEVERTEKINIDYNSAIQNIFTEIKKDDNLSPSKVLDIVSNIQEIKRARKRWVAGTSRLYGDPAVTTHKNGQEKKFFIQLPQLRFNPSVIVLYYLSGTPCLYSGSGSDGQMLDIIRSQINNVVSVVTGGKNIYFRCGLYGDISMDEYIGNYFDVNSYSTGPITFLCAESYHRNAYLLDSNATVNWIAFE